MTYHDDFTLSAALLEQHSTQGLGALPDLFPVLLNAAMQIERHISLVDHRVEEYWNSGLMVLSFPGAHRLCQWALRGSSLLGRSTISSG